MVLSLKRLPGLGTQLSGLHPAVGEGGLEFRSSGFTEGSVSVRAHLYSQNSRGKTRRSQSSRTQTSSRVRKPASVNRESSKKTLTLTSSLCTHKWTHACTVTHIPHTYTYKHTRGGWHCMFIRTLEITRRLSVLSQNNLKDTNWLYSLELSRTSFFSVLLPGWVEEVVVIDRLIKAEIKNKDRICHFKSVSFSKVASGRQKKSDTMFNFRLLKVKMLRLTRQGKSARNVTLLSLKK